MHIVHSQTPERIEGFQGGVRKKIKDITSIFFLRAEGLTNWMWEFTTKYIQMISQGPRNTICAHLFLGSYDYQMQVQDSQRQFAHYVLVSRYCNGEHACIITECKVIRILEYGIITNLQPKK